MNAAPLCEYTELAKSLGVQTAAFEAMAWRFIDESSSATSATLAHKTRRRVPVVRDGQWLQPVEVTDSDVRDAGGQPDGKAAAAEPCRGDRIHGREFVPEGDERGQTGRAHSKAEAEEHRVHGAGERRLAGDREAVIWLVVWLETHLVEADPGAEADDRPSDPDGNLGAPGIPAQVERPDGRTPDGRQSDQVAPRH